MADQPSTATAAGPPPDPGAARPASSSRLLLFAAGVVLALVAGFALGRVAGGAGGSDPQLADHTHAPVAAGDGHDHSGQGGGADAAVSGLAVGDGTFLLAVDTPAFAAGEEGELRFRVLDAQRRTVTDFAIAHDKPMHLIVARRDLSGFQHLHPTMAADGTWSIPLTLPAAGAWRAYADFTATPAGGQPTASVLGVDLTVAGDYRPRPLPAPATATSVAGLDVAYEGRARVGAAQPFLFRITRGGSPVAVERYLGAYGHLVALREGDLGYVHVHPEEELTDGAVKFWLAAPSPGRYRLYLDIQVDGQVHTAEFTLVVD